MNVAITTRATTGNLMSFVLMIIMAVFVTALTPKVATATVVLERYATSGKVITRNLEFPVWVTETTVGTEMIVNLGVSVKDDEKEFFRRMQIFQRSIKVPGCVMISEVLLNLNRLALFAFICEGGVKPDAKVKYLTLSAAEQTVDAASPYRRLHRPWMPTI